MNYAPATIAPRWISYTNYIPNFNHGLYICKCLMLKLMLHVIFDEIQHLAIVAGANVGSPVYTQGSMCFLSWASELNYVVHGLCLQGPCLHFCTLESIMCASDHGPYIQTCCHQGQLSCKELILILKILTWPNYLSYLMWILFFYDWF